MALSKSVSRWIIASVTLLAFVLVAAVINYLLNLDTIARVVLWSGMIVLGLIAAGSIAWFLRPREVLSADTGDDVLLTIGSARARLPRGSFGKRAMVIVLGPSGGTKTTIVARSGGDPELLAGVAPASATEPAVSTKTVNVWAMRDAVVTELGGELLSDAGRWQAAIRALRAPRVAAAFGKSEAPPRSAVVCVPCDLFYTGGNGQQLEELGHLLRQRLAETSRELGLAMPVYVVFTRMDRLPNFEEWIGVFAKDELRAPLGATLPFDATATSGNYVERLTPRILLAFRQFIDNLAVRRTDLLGRDGHLGRRYGAYELPRELRKLAPAVSSFLIELCRPTQLGSSPQLRGFYFVGARPVVITDVAASSAARSQSAAAATEATQIFHDFGSFQAPVAASGATTSRKVPEWVFLDRFLRDVVLADTGAASVASGGVQVKRTRRLMLAAGSVACLLMLAAVTVSWARNRAMTSRVESAARAVAALPTIQAVSGTITYPSAQSLRVLEALRVQLDSVRGYLRSGPPATMRLGLWNGEALYQAARPVWYEGFRAQLFAMGWKALEDSLKSLPAVPGEGNDYTLSYNWLKAYLITTAETARSTSEFLSPVLLESARRGQTLDAEIAVLSRRQFDFYSSELPTYNPWPRDADGRLVPRTRDFLSRFTGGQQIYRNMLAGANKEVDSLALQQTPGVLTVQPYVKGAFTAKGAGVMAQKFAGADTASGGEPWVVGAQTKTASVDQSALRLLYATDYANTWRGVVQSARVVRPTTVKDGASKLEVISNNTSPLLAFLRVVAVQTNIDSVTRKAFQPVHVVTPPEITDKIISEKNQPYVDGLVGLQGALAQIGNMSTTDSVSISAYNKAAFDAGLDVRKAREATKKVAGAFQTTPPSIAGPVQELLLAPISGAETVLSAAGSLRWVAPRVAAVPPPAPPPVVAPVQAPVVAPPPVVVAPNPSIALNERGARLCTELTPMLNKFPFNSDAATDVSIAEVSAMFAPGTGKLWAFYQDHLSPYLEKTAGKWVAKPGKAVTLSPLFIEYFNRAALISSALYSENNTTPALQWKARAEVSAILTPLVSFKHGGSESHFDVKTPRNIVDWPQPLGSSATLEATFAKDKPIQVATATGEWALFRLVAKGQSEIVGREVKVTFPAPAGKNAQPVVMEFELIDPPGVPVLKKGWLGGLNCVAQVAQ